MASDLLDTMDTCGMELPAIDSSPLNPCEPTSPSVPKNWSETLFPNMRPPKKFNLRFIPPKTRDEKVIGVCQKAAVEGELAVLDLTLVDFFLGRKPSFSFVKAALLRQWKLQGNVEIIQMLQGGYAFRFSDLRDRDYILEGDVYFVGGQPMFLRAWERSLHTGGILGLRKIPLWVSFPGLPLHLWGEEALSSICSVLGIPLYADRNTAMKTRLVYARVCVEFLGDKPLLESITIEDELGLTYEQKVIYDWNPPHCLTCGVFGHVDCGVKGKCRELEVKSLEKASNHATSIDVSQQKHLSESSFLEEGFGRESCQTMKEGEEDEGWETVRVRKKKSDGLGDPKPGLFRPDSQGVNGGTNGVSTSHWRKQNLSAGQVRQTDSFPKMVDFLKLKSCPSPVPGPPSFSEKAKMDGVLSNPPIEPLDLSKPIENLKPGPTGSMEPLDSPKPLETMNPGPTSSGTLAGHTPFPNRLATLARELRRRQSGKAGLRTSAISGPTITGEAYGDSHSSLSTPLLATLNNEDPIRPGNDLRLNPGESGKIGNNMTRLEDCLGIQRRENAMKNKELQKDRDTYSGKILNHNFPDLHGGRNDLKDVERNDIQADKIRRNNGEDGQITELGHGMAEIQ